MMAYKEKLCLSLQSAVLCHHFVEQHDYSLASAADLKLQLSQCAWCQHEEKCTAQHVQAGVFLVWCSLAATCFASLLACCEWDRQQCVEYLGMAGEGRRMERKRASRSPVPKKKDEKKDGKKGKDKDKDREDKKKKR